MALQAEDFEYFSNLIKEKSGIFLTKDKDYLLESRLNPIVQKYGLRDLSQLVLYCKEKKDGSLFEEIVEAMTTNESLFFRDKKPFDCLKDIIIPRIIGKCPDKRHIRIWSAACSTGQEPYSIAMTIMEEPLLASLTFEILATDVDKNVINKAQAGKYSQFEIQRGVPINYLIKYFTQEGEDWCVKEVLKQRIKFTKFNLLDKPNFSSKFDIIFCRNVLIYFDQPTKANIIMNMENVLEPHGALLLGCSENIFGIDGTGFSALKNSDGNLVSGVFVLDK
ncbi:MAG: protein-glutamate O-methyltransferase CheR [Rickettsiales bacterium]|nr:protein-glutamate O-methyltransferase CheR [Pseudomonadota bacterium]MDA0966532.1 protein-glutamate O-methyltransferase CheR [Pseudomonadota bacterium]MDG4543394.1 protein-glutamate O-methyltransferase CheR [Rickettsiales bacterium]MDG4546636.1 protein-glutamate O-methyltransferase CheR [Rickettsiales bacterium]MDG4548109.1 protein-glutamate O-methyltransferase CheR [Rickettsiales bacterium]